jgi:hypothetical protein
MARNMAAHAPQVKPKAYFPISAFMPASLNTLRALTKVVLRGVNVYLSYVGIVSYVIRTAARVIQNRAKPRMRPDAPDARREHGASIEVKNAKTSKMRAIK